MRQLELDLCGEISLVWVRHPRARHYRLRVLPDGRVRITLPRWGSKREAMAFVERQMTWIRRQRQRMAARVCLTRAWGEGTEILFRGLRAAIHVQGQPPPGVACFADQVVTLEAKLGDLRAWIEQHLWQLARREVPTRVLELAQQHGAQVRKVVVRNQRSRWGSCSVRGTISLNWRLIQLPPSVSDYLILHELAHLTHMNHSMRFWRHVAEICPGFREAELWLRRHRDLLRD